MKCTNYWHELHSWLICIHAHCKQSRVILTELVTESMHSIMREQSGLRSCYSLIGFIQWPSCYQSRSYNVPACYQCPLKAYSLLTNCPLKIYNVYACCQMLHKWGHLNACHQLFPCLSPNIPTLVNSVPPKKGTYTHLDMSNWNRGNQAQLKQPCSFYSVELTAYHGVVGRYLQWTNRLYNPHGLYNLFYCLIIKRSRYLHCFRYVTSEVEILDKTTEGTDRDSYVQHPVSNWLTMWFKSSICSFAAV